jgi:hypothetical protein
MTRFVVGDDRSQSTYFPSGWMTIWARTIRSGRSMCWSMSLTWPSSALTELSRRRQEASGPLSDISDLQSSFDLAATSSK